jgi:hypothetical protein
MAGLGCSTGRQVRTAGSLHVVDTAPAQPSKGYVEFYSVATNAVVPIYLLDDQRHARLLGATGLHKGDHYSFQRHETIVAEKLRVALAPGSHLFMVERDGKTVRVPVEAGKVTSVQIDYSLVYAGVSYVVCRIDSLALKTEQ